MTEYIDREAVLEKGAVVPGYFCNMISAWDVAHIPAADVAPVRHGQWKATAISGTLWCTACKSIMPDYMPKTPFCPMCGAIMDMKE